MGFSTYSGTVTAASDWNALAERKRVRPAVAGSYEELFHSLGLPRFLLLLQGDAVVAGLKGPKLERAIGVIYRPETERLSHYFHVQLPDQFDAVLHFEANFNGKAKGDKPPTDSGVIIGPDAQPGKIATAFIKAIAQHRHWSREMKDSGFE